MTAQRRATTQRTLVQAALTGQDRFRTAQDLFAELRAAGHPVGLSTVYRHLQALADEHLADVVRTGDGEAAYRYCGAAAGGHHHHLICRRCGYAQLIRASSVERWAQRVGQEHGYRDVDHTVEIFGVCARCTG
jgi:Fur family transcriptional regulator, ferric uptake regulator